MASSMYLWRVYSSITVNWLKRAISDQSKYLRTCDVTLLSKNAINALKGNKFCSKGLWKVAYDKLRVKPDPKVSIALGDLVFVN